MRSENYLLDMKKYSLPSGQLNFTHIYFIKCEINKHVTARNKVKIGIAKDPQKRLIELQIGSPFDLTLIYYFRVSLDQAPYLERSLHKKFKWSNKRGEWFNFHSAVVKWMKEHKAFIQNQENRGQRQSILRKNTDALGMKPEELIS